MRDSRRSMEQCSDANRSTGLADRSRQALTSKLGSFAMFAISTHHVGTPVGTLVPARNAANRLALAWTDPQWDSLTAENRSEIYRRH